MKQTMTFFISILTCFISIAQNVRLKDDITTGRTPMLTKKIDYLNDSRNVREDMVRYNRQYRYVLVNVNRFVYKDAAATQMGMSLNMERPEILKNIKLPAAINTSAIDYKSLADAKELDTCHCESAKKMIGTNPVLNRSYDSLLKKGQRSSALVKIFNSNTGIKHRLDELMNDIASPWDSIGSRKSRLISDSLHLNIGERDTLDMMTGFFLTAWQNIQQTSDSMSVYAAIITDKLNERIRINKQCLLDYSRKLRCLDSCKSAGYNGIEDKIMALEKCIKALETFRDGINSDADEVQAAAWAMQKALDDGTVKSLQTMYNKLVQENFELELESFVADKDVYVINFTTKTETPLIFGKPSSRNIKVTAVTYGGWKVDYSTGAFYNFGSNKFFGPEYYFQDRAIDTTKAVIEARKTKKAMLSVGTLMHIYPRLRSFVRPGLALGVSTTIGFDVLNFHAGLSLLFGRPGKANRIIVTGGLTFREVNLLDSRFALNDYRKDYGDAVPTSKNFPVKGYFFGVTYNLSGINK